MMDKKELERKFSALEEVCDQQMERLVGQQAKRIQAEAKLLCPVRQGELRNSIKSMTERMDDRVIGNVYTNKAYAMYVEMGTGPKGPQTMPDIPCSQSGLYHVSLVDT